MDNSSTPIRSTRSISQISLSGLKEADALPILVNLTTMIVRLILHSSHLHISSKTYFIINEFNKTVDKLNKYDCGEKTCDLVIRKSVIYFARYIRPLLMAYNAPLILAKSICVLDIDQLESKLFAPFLQRDGYNIAKKTKVEPYTGVYII